jgi:hypothetical protein
MTLGEKQELFSRCLAQLLPRMHDAGYAIRIGQAERSVEEATRLGKANSIHTKRLAIDLHLFYAGEYLHETEDHQAFGEFWEGLHELCRWGGRFRDGNHYSIEHEGVR